MTNKLDSITKQNDSSDPKLRATAKPDQRWGHWRFNAENLTLAFQHPRHNWTTEIDLERTNTPARLLDAIFQTVGGRPDWVFTPKDKADLLLALEEILDPQATLCPWGVSKQFDTAQFFADIQSGSMYEGTPVTCLIEVNQYTDWDYNDRTEPISINVAAIACLKPTGRSGDGTSLWIRGGENELHLREDYSTVKSLIRHAMRGEFAALADLESQPIGRESK